MCRGSGGTPPPLTGFAGRVPLLGAFVAASGYREAQRDREWDRLRLLGAKVAQMDTELADLRGARHEMVVKAIAWGARDAQIAEAARMSRQSVHKIRTPVDGTAGQEDDR
jgi:hypothetical protein